MSSAKRKKGLVCPDVPDHKPARGVLRECEERFRSLVESTDNAVYLIDRNLRFLYANTKYLSRHGFTIEKIADLEYEKFHSAEETAEFAGIVRKAVESGVSITYEHTDEKDGKVFLRTISPLREPRGGEVTKVTVISKDITERKRTEEALKKSEKRYRTLVDHIPQKIFLKDRHSVYISCNENYARALNLKSDEIGGKTDYDFYPKELAEKYRKDDRRVIDSGETEEIEEQYTQDGRNFWVHTTKTPLKDENGNIIGLLGIFWDITQRKRAEEALQERMKELTCLYEVQSDIQKDLSVDEICGRVIEHLVPAMWFPEISAAVIELDGRRFTTERYTEGLSDGLHAEIRIGGRARGYVRIYNTEKRPFIIPHESNLVNGVAEAVSLWLERKMAEEALQESKEFAENLIASMQDGISVLDSDGVHIGVNAAFCQMTGFSREELIGVGLPHPYWPPEAYEEIEKAFHKTSRGEFDDIELTFMRKNGERFPVIVSPSWVKNKQSNVTSYFATVKDITERKRAEAERERLLADLKAKNKEMEAFVYTVSHDLKSPLVSLGGFSSALKKEHESQLGEEGKHYLERIQANIVQMGNLITNLLEVSRLGRALGPIEEIDVAALLRQIGDALAIKLKEVGAEFVVLEPLPIIRADRSGIYQVFVNLIVNAVKFKGTDRVLRIEVGCRQESDFYRFHVADNGIGIGPEYHEQIFAPFRKLHLEIEGTGIGLALVKKIVENHGGQVWVESPSTSLRAGNEGAGATFYFTLPM